MARPRLLVVSPVYPPARGGIETLAGRLVDQLEADFAIEVIALRPPGDLAPDDHVPVARLPNEPVGGRKSVLRLNAATAARLLRTPPDVVLSMHVRGGPAARLGRLARGVPLVQYVHAKEVFEFPETSRFVLPRAQKVIGVSRYARDLALGTGAEPSATVVIPNGVDAAPPRTMEPDARPTILTVSRLEDRYKGHDVLLAALPEIRAAVPDVRWVIVGDGSLRPELEARAAELGLAEVVSFAGAVSDAERDTWLERATAFVMPTRVPGPGKAGEGFGIVFLEAAARGLPSVAGRVPGVVDAVEDGVSGLLVDPEDAGDVARATIALLGDRARAAALGLDARTRAEGFSWEGVGRRVAVALHETIAENPRRRVGPRSNRVAFAREFLGGT
ncbi:MAG: glycosyl transferase group 1 [Conexibacter sp.]|nr:glycosyl transferase group 1 [Conexibacter sp.]